MSGLWCLGERAAALLTNRGERIAVCESSSGGLISAALLAVPGASVFYVAGGVVYTPRALFGLMNVGKEDFRNLGIRSSTEGYAAFLAKTIRERVRVDWGLSESGAAGPTGNGYGDPAGHSVIAVSGKLNQTRILATGSHDRRANMNAFAIGALTLLVECLDVGMTSQGGH